MFFGTALLFWTRVIDSPPWRSRSATCPRAVYLGLAMLVSWVLAIAFAVATSPVYAPYAAEASRPGGLTALADQQLAAGVMWVPGSIPLAIAILFVVYRWLQPKWLRAPRAALSRSRNPRLIAEEDDRIRCPTCSRSQREAQGILTWAIPLGGFLAVSSGTSCCFAAGIPE